MGRDCAFLAASSLIAVGSGHGSCAVTVDFLGFRPLCFVLHLPHGSGWGVLSTRGYPGSLLPVSARLERSLDVSVVALRFFFSQNARSGA